MTKETEMSSLMKTSRRILAGALVCAAPVIFMSMRAHNTPAAAKAAAPKPAATDAQTKAIVDAAAAFLGSLNAAQRAKVQFAFTPQKAATSGFFKGGMNGRMTFVGEQYGQAVWSNFPVSDVPRPGLALGTLSDEQSQSAMRLLQALLSKEGYQKVIDIMGSDQVLADSGTRYASGAAHYTLGIFGTPGDKTPWMLQFGGHHLALSAVIAGPNVSIAPTLTGAQPASYTRDGQTVHPLGDENDKAFRLMNALSAEQQKKATLDYEIRDLVLGPGQDGRTLPPEGLPAPEMTEPQQAMLLDLIGEWVGMLNANDAAPKMAQIRANLSRTHFAWRGDTTNPSQIYFRITGPTLHIEFAHQGAGGGPGGGLGVQAGGLNHIHTIYRDPTDSYGRAHTSP